MWLCWRCHIDFPTEETRDLHKCQGNTEEDEVFHCEKCDYSVDSFDALQLHLCTHTKEDRVFMSDSVVECASAGKSASHQIYPVNTSILLQGHNIVYADPQSCTGSNSKAEKGSLGASNVDLIQSTKDTPYVCGYCDETFSEVSQLQVHMVHHTAKKGANACTHCAMSFDNPLKLREHLRTHQQPEFPYPCPKCNKVFKDLKTMNDHAAVHRKKGPQTTTVCHICDAAFDTPPDLRKHMRSHDGIGRYICNICGKQLNNSHSLKTHKDNHTAIKSHVCVECGKLFSCSHDLKRHMIKHTSDKPFACDECGNLYKHLKDVKKHKAKTHEKVIEHICPICGQEFPMPDELFAHLDMHIDNSKIKSTKAKKDQLMNQLMSSESRKMDKDIHSGNMHHVCLQCGKGCGSADDLKMHMTKHNADKPFACNECDMIYKRLHDLKTHKAQKHLKVQQHICTVCDQGFLMAHNLKVHMESHTRDNSRVIKKKNNSSSEGKEDFPSAKASTLSDGKPGEHHKCSACGEKFGELTELESHRQTHVMDHSYFMLDKKKNKLPESMMSCKECNCIFHCVKNVEWHMQTVHGKESFSMRSYIKNNLCNICGMMCAGKASLKTHMAVHSDERPHPCDQCDRAFKKVSALKRHIMTHTGEKPHLCPDCGKGFVGPAQMRSHRRTHGSEKAFACKICDKRFTQKASLHSHMVYHGKKNHVCSECGKAFYCKTKLTIHKLIHTGEKPHSCTHCTKTFRTTELLRIHIRIHTGEKPYKCKICDRGFSQRSSCKSHQKTHTTGEERSSRRSHEKTYTKGKASSPVSKQEGPVDVPNILFDFSDDYYHGSSSIEKTHSRKSTPPAPSQDSSIHVPHVPMVYPGQYPHISSSQSSSSSAVNTHIEQRPVPAATGAGYMGYPQNPMYNKYPHISSSQSSSSTHVNTHLEQRPVPAATSAGNIGYPQNPMYHTGGHSATGQEFGQCMQGSSVVNPAPRFDLLPEYQYYPGFPNPGYPTGY